jgi:4'-phosphopantetheinyl transferase
MSVPEAHYRIGDKLCLGCDELHVWLVDLDALAPDLDRWEKTLCDDERERAQRFRFLHLHSRFVGARGVLRTLLGAYLEVSPGALRFRYSDKGKPTLDQPYSDSQLQFNLSHSEQVALLAFARDRELGVDVERLQKNFDVEGIAKRFFSPAEQKAIFALPRNQWPEAFFTCWTRKEAFVKAKGDGLSLPLDQFDVAVVPGQAAELLGTRPDPEEKNRWSLTNLDVVSGFVAAVAVRGPALRVRMISQQARKEI